MQSALKKIGNSTGVLIPKPLLTEIGAQAGDNIDIRVEANCIVLELAKRRPREGWAEDAKRIAEAGDDHLVWPEFGNDGDDDLTW